MKTVPVSDLLAEVGDADYELVTNYSWSRFVDRNELIYARRYWREGGRQYGQFMHTLLTGFRLTDHIDHNGLNNQRYNLRDGADGVNARNARPLRVGTSQYKGVYWHKRDKAWTAQIWIDSRRKWLGNFADEVQAARAYDAAATVFFRDSACLNFPERAR